MRRTRHTHTALFGGMGLALFLGAAPVARSADLLNQQTPRGFVRTYGGYTTYKSQLVGSNDTTISFGYELGIFTGENKSLGMIVGRESTSVTFSLDKSTVKNEFQDVEIRYRFFHYLYLGAVLGSGRWAVSRPNLNGNNKIDHTGDPKEFVNATTEGYGASFGVQVPLERSSLVYLDAKSVSPSTTRVLPVDPQSPYYQDPSSGTRKVSVGSRTSFDIGGQVDITDDLVDGAMGVRRSTYGLSVDGTSYSDTLTMTYVAFRLGYEF